MQPSKKTALGIPPANAESSGFYGGGGSRLMNILGGMASLGQPTYSECGYEAGASFVWGWGSSKGKPDQDDLVWDLVTNSKQLIFWNTNPIITTVRTGSGAYAANLYLYLKELGKKIIAVLPDYNHSAQIFGDACTWIPIIPGTDAAVAAAIANVWISEGTYDKQYVATHSIGFDEQSLPSGAPKNSSFKAYIDGSMDGVPKTPEWAEKISGVKARVIRVLARQLASMPTMWSAAHGGGQRGGYGHEFARYMAVLLTMQGWGKPGVNIWDYCAGWPAKKMRAPSADLDDLMKEQYSNKSGKQWLLKYLLFEGITNPPVSWVGDAKIGSKNEGIFKPFTYPVEGFSPIKMLYSDAHSMLNTCVRSPSMARAMMSPKVEFNFTFSPWWGGTCTYADLVLPRTSLFEMEKIASSGDDIHEWIVYTPKIIEPLGESKTDFEFFLALAKRLGIQDKFAEGKTSFEQVHEAAFNESDLAPLMSYEQFKKVGYVYNPSLAADPAYKPKAVSARWIYEKKELGKGDLTTVSGKIEFFSQTIFKYKGVNDPGIHPVPKYYNRRDGRYSPLAKKYPLECLTIHRIHREHSQMDNTAMLQECYKVYDKDGYPHEPIYMNRVDAEARGIKDGDIVRVFNDIGATLCGAKITKTLVPGVVILYMGAQYEYVNPRDPVLDKAGSANIVTKGDGQSEFARVYVDVQPLVQIELWKG